MSQSEFSDSNERKHKESTDNIMPSLLKGGLPEPKRSGVTPFMKKKENIEDRARINELAVTI